MCEIIWENKLCIFDISVSLILNFIVELNKLRIVEFEEILDLTSPNTKLLSNNTLMFYQ